MRDDEVAEFAKILRRNDIDYIFVGGVAIRTQYPSETLDFDVMVVPRDFRTAVKRIDKDPAVVAMDRAPVSMPGGHVIVKGALVRFDLLDPGAYSGTRPGSEFYLYVRRYASGMAPFGRVARPPVVWYMRLVIDQYELYFLKILRDLRAGVPWTTVDKVGRISARFGVAEMTSHRIEQLSEVARIAGLH
jgi:hypothetical protein